METKKFRYKPDETQLIVSPKLQKGKAGSFHRTHSEYRIVWRLLIDRSK